MSGGNNDIDEGVQELNIDVAAGMKKIQYTVGGLVLVAFSIFHHYIHHNCFKKQEQYNNQIFVE